MYNSLQSYFVIHSDLSKNFSNQIEDDILPRILECLNKNKENFKEKEIFGKNCEKKMKELRERNDKVL